MLMAFEKKREWVTELYFAVKSLLQKETKSDICAPSN